jgi:undecaprenyl-phosphate galactose phosphotransferase
MQKTTPSFVRQASASLPLQDTVRKEEKLRLILDEITDVPDELHLAHALPFRDNVARALRGFRLTDIAALVVGFAAAWGLAYATNALFLGRTDLADPLQFDLVKNGQSLLVGLCAIAWFTQGGHYRMRMPFWTETKSVVETIGVAMLLDVFLRFIVKQDFSRLALISGWVFVAAGIILFRALWRHYKRKQGLWNVSTLLVGGGKTAQEARRALASEPVLGFTIKAQIGDLPSAFRQAGFSWQRLCVAHKVDYVVIALDGNDLVEAEQALAQLLREDVPFSVSPPLHNIPVIGMVQQHFFNHDVMLLTHNHGLNQRLPRLIKRGFDIVIALSALLVLSPALLVVALIIQLDGSPVLFRHKRLGLNGKTFPCLKFRSMIVNSDAVLKKYLAGNAEARAEWMRDRKLRNDPRTTRFGTFLRRTSIDELPQLLNVLKGDMSIVGPRPIIVAETEKYDNDISHYYRVRPGITGLWQVSGRNDVLYNERVRMDSWYVRNWSLWHDIAIICKTIPAVLKRDGAY